MKPPSTGMRFPGHRNPPPPVDHCKGCPYKPFITDGPVTVQPLVPDNSTIKDVIKELKRINKQKRILDVKHEVGTTSSFQDKITSYGAKILGKPLTYTVTFTIQDL